MSLQKGVDGPSNDLGVVEMDVVRSWHRTVLVQRICAVRLHCCSVQLLSVPLLGVRLHRNILASERHVLEHLDQKVRTSNVPAELEKELRGKAVEGSHL